ncbi:MAG: insulinase family protein [Polyangiaceae bacterium]|nr:insulinase family protein [Polyangiaceae bacterium]
MRSSHPIAVLTTLLAIAPSRGASGADVPSGSDEPASSSSLPVSLAAEKVQLPNGLTVIYDEDHRTPIVTVNLWYHVGSKDEPPGRNGFAHLFEHLMFQGSKHVPEDMYFRFLEKAGATSINGTTNTDRTNYFQTVPRTELPLALWLESDRMGFLLDHVDEATFKSQRDVVKNERRQNYENAPYGLVLEAIRAALFPEGHPYHLLTIGTPNDLDRATLADVEAFFHKHYVPNNCSLVISGDIDKASAKALVEKYFGPIPRGEHGDAATRQKPAVVTHSGEARIEMEAAVELARVYVSWPTPAFFQSGDADLDLVAHVLTGGKTSRLYKRLVYDLQIAQSTSASQQSSELASVFEIVATARPGHSANELASVIDEELDKLRTSGVSDAELARAKVTIEADNIFDLERNSSRANRLNTYEHYVGDPNYLAQDMARTTRATTASVLNAARTWLLPKDRVVTLVTPNKQAPVAGRVVAITRGTK